MTDLLIVVDMQRDFVSGALGSEQARAIVPAVAARIRQAKAEQTQVAFTLDTHEPDYLNTREGRFLPVPHCIRDTLGWALEPDIAKECAQGMISFAKPTFGSAALCEYVRALAEEKGAADGKGFCVELCGVCTDICVVSNALRLNLFQLYNGRHDRKIQHHHKKHAKEQSAMTKTMKIKGMMCQHCVARVKKALEAVDGVEEAVVDLDAKTAVAKLAHEVDDAPLKAAVEEQDYEVTGVE